MCTEKPFFALSLIWIRKSYFAKISAAPALSKQQTVHSIQREHLTPELQTTRMFQGYLFQHFVGEKTGVSTADSLALGRHCLM